MAALVMAATPVVAAESSSAQPETAVVEKRVPAVKPNDEASVDYPKTPENQFRDGLRWIGNAKTEEMKKRGWLRLAEVLPTKTIENSELIDPPYIMEVMRVAANSAVEKDPVGFLQHAVFCTDLPNYLDLLKKAADRAADIDPKATLSLSDRFGDFPWGKPILAKAKKNLESKLPKDKLVKK